LLVLAETEFWPNLLSSCHRSNIPVAVVNARISDRSWPRYQRLRGLWEPFLRRLALVLAQSEIDAERLRSLGCGTVSVGGNLKYDVRAAGETKATILLRQLSSSLRLFVAGSTLEGEEAALLAAWPALLVADPALAMVLAPRHPERFPAIAGLLANSAIPWRKRSELGDKPLVPGEIVLLDTIGELASIYSLAAVAFVGGSLIPAGGHNPLEPAQFGIPVVMGSYYQNFQAMVEDLIHEQAIVITTPAELQPTLTRLLLNPAEAKELGERARVAFTKQGGATARTVTAIVALVKAGGRP
jgi:3-deoxy-D-manno-octulosonic-acid transferase